MMNNTKEIKAHFERSIVAELEAALNKIKSEGFTDSTYTTLRLLEQDIKQLNAAEHFYGAWHSDSILERKGA